MADTDIYQLADNIRRRVRRTPEETPRTAALDTSRVHPAAAAEPKRPPKQKFLEIVNDHKLKVVLSVPCLLSILPLAFVRAYFWYWNTEDKVHDPNPPLWSTFLIVWTFGIFSWFFGLLVAIIREIEIPAQERHWARVFFDFLTYYLLSAYTLILFGALYVNQKDTSLSLKTTAD